MSLLQQPHLQTTLVKHNNSFQGYMYTKYAKAFVDYFQCKYPSEYESLDFSSQINRRQYGSNFLDRKVISQVEIISEYLKVMGVEHEVDASRPVEHNMASPILLPSQNKVLLVCTQRNLNFDKETPDGYFLQTSINIQAAHPSLTLIQLNMNKFYELAEEPINVVNYFIEQGIQSNKETYDFTQITFK